MRQELEQESPGRDFTSRSAPRGISFGLLLCVVLASGAAFGTAAQSALHHLGLDLSSIHNDLIAGHVARARSALAWWCWCVVPVAAFFVGPVSAALTRTVVSNWWRLRALRLSVTAAAVVGLAAIGQLQPAPSTFAFTTNAALDLFVVVGSALLAVFGARFFGSLAVNTGPVRLTLDLIAEPLAVAQPWRGGGSAVGGLPFLRFRERQPLAPGAFSLGRLALVAVLALVVFAVVSALGGATALLHSVAPAVVRHLAAAWLPPAESRARTVALALLPVEPPRPVVMPPVAWLDLPPPPKPADRPEPRQRAISVSVGYASGTFAESELTFTKGYSRRRAAQLVANMTSLPSIPQLTAAINIKKIRAASLRFTQDRRLNRTVADNPSSAEARHVADKRHRASRQARGQSRYAEYNSYSRYNSPYGANRYNRHEGRHRYGDSRFARADQFYRRF